MGVMVPAFNQLLRQEDHEFEGCLGYSEGPCLKRKEMRRKDRGAEERRGEGGGEQKRG